VEITIMGITSIRLQPDLEHSLEVTAEELHRSKNWIINEALREYLFGQTLEAKRWQETLEALDSMKAGKVVDSEDVHKWLESWGKENESAPPRQ